jgi:hypothetical protein
MLSPLASQRDAIKNIRTFPQLIKFLRNELEWPIESDDFEELMFDYTPEELGIDAASAAKILDANPRRSRSARSPLHDESIMILKRADKVLPPLEDARLHEALEPAPAAK